MYNNIALERSVYASEEHQMIAQAVRDFLEKEVMPYHEQWEEDQMVDRDIWTKAGQLGLLCVDMPVEYGGGGMDVSYSLMIDEIISEYGASGVGFSLHTNIAAPYIGKYGTDAQKKKFLGNMSSGKWIAALGMTEPSTGSDLQKIKTSAVDAGDHWIVNGSKTFITNGYLSDIVIMAVKTRPGTDEEGVSMLLMEVDTPGFTKGQPLKKLGLKAQDTCELFMEDVKVPKENLLGEEGRGFIYMMTELARERLDVAVQSIGGARKALNDTIKYVNERHAFGGPVAQFQNTQFKLAEMATELQVSEAYVDRCMELLKTHELTAQQSSMAKLYCTEMHGRVADQCLQLHGGYGYIWEYDICKNYADARVSRIYAGTNEIMKVLISRGLLPEYHAEMKKQRKARHKASTDQAAKPAAS